MNVHVPLYPPKKFLREISSGDISYLEMVEMNDKIQKNPDRISKEDLLKIINLYDAEVRYVDYHLCEFIEKLESMGINFNNTYFIITSDHGTDFGEHGSFAHFSVKLYDERLRYL